MRTADIKQQFAMSCLGRSPFFFLIVFTTHTVRAAPGKSKISDRPQITAAYYLDNRDFNTLTIIVSSKRLPLGLSMWGFTDLHGDAKGAGSRSDFTRSFSEYTLSDRGLGRRIGMPGIGVRLEYNDAGGLNNSLLRFGITYQHKQIRFSPFTDQRGWLEIRGFPLESDGDGGQLALAYFLPIHHRVTVSGFADLNFINNGSSQRWVIEPQLNVQIHNQFWAVLEYRYNDFERVSKLDGEGFAAGIRIDF